MPRPREISSRTELRELQRTMARALFCPLGEKISARRAEQFIKPNERLSSLERLEIYRRQYWFRLLDSLREDYPALQAVLGEERFMRMAEGYLTRNPSGSYTLRDLGSRLERFLRREPEWLGAQAKLALDVARYEWAQIVAFDGAASAPFTGRGLTDPGKLRLGLQPHLTLLELNFAVDDFVAAVKRRERGVASNAVSFLAKKTNGRRIALPRTEKSFVAIYRHDNSVYSKRLEPEAFSVLRALQRGATLETACARFAASGGPGKIRSWFLTWSALGWFCRRPRTKRG